MSAEPKLVIFDVDGTLVDSQAHIVASMAAAFEAVQLAVPERERILSIVGLSLPVAIAELAPGASASILDTMVQRYKDAYTGLRSMDGDAASPLFAGAREVLDRLGAHDNILLGIATGKSRRGLRHLFDLHGFAPLFVTSQTADDHPSKPHPAMVLAALAETGVDPKNAVMIGDTSFDMEMGRAAGVRTMAVTWGYHPGERLARCQPDATVDNFAALHAAILNSLELTDD
ncbi:HAD-IA family hydrolase [Qingshengfaniella alkalisoli]|uniref:HAD-IA family hydrolase n=1 Tax=Qingshengfaniella alkalisoli TaxID=2599296 RepID=UPI001F0ED06A|nr:HAD-IA family hydrolase [Qingshengfaniella alkalisoli]